MKGASVRQIAGGIHLKRVMEGEFLATLSDALRQFAAGLRTVAFAPTAHDVEIFQRETRRIYFGVARIAGFEGAVLVELLTDGDGAADVGFERGHAGRRGGRFLAKNALHNPSAAQ